MTRSGLMMEHGDLYVNTFTKCHLSVARGTGSYGAVTG